METKAHRFLTRTPRSAWALPAAALAGLVLFGINEAAYDRSVAALSSLQARDQARGQVRQVLRALIQSESAQSGHLLAGREGHLQPYERATGTAQTSLAWLARHYAPDSEAEPLVTEMTRLGLARLSVLEATLQLQARRRNDDWRDLMLTDIGREHMQGLRGAGQSLLELETRRAETERASVLSTMRAGRIGVNVMTVLSLLALLVFLRQTLAFDKARRGHATALQTERDRLEAEATRQSAELTGLARDLQAAREDEGSRLARELHDELGALLTSAKLDVARLKRMIGELSPEVEERLRHLNEAINRGVALKRRIIEELRPSSLDTLGLVVALDILTREHAARTGVQMHSELTDVTLSANARITAFRLVQAALNNAALQAASEIHVSLQPQDRGSQAGARVTVRADGRAFDASERSDFTRNLMGLRYRVEGEGGEMSAQRASEHGGTEVTAWFSLLAPPPADVAPP